MSTKPLNETAARARDRALKKHRLELMFWKGLIIPIGALGLAVGVAAGMLIQEAIEDEPPQVWRTDKAPALQPLHVVTKAYLDDKGNWKNYEDGTPLLVSHWTPVQP
jgi:hypothetical protein